MKRIGVIAVGLVLLMAQVFWLAQPAASFRASRVPACCASHVFRANTVPAAAGIAMAPCCSRSCCAQAPSGPLSQAPVVPTVPDAPRFLPGAVVLAFLWSLPAAPHEPATLVSAFADAVQEPAVPLFSRHCALLI